MGIHSDHPTARDVWRLALPLGTRLVAGAKQLQRHVLWARASSHMSTLFPGLGAGELALLDLYLAREINPSLTLPRIIRALVRVDISALATESPLEDESVAVAEEVGLPLFHLPRGTDYPRTARAVNRLIMDREAQEEARAAELYQQLTQQIATGAGLTGMLELLATLTGHRVLLVESDGRYRQGEATGTTAIVSPPDLAPAWGTSESAVVVHQQTAGTLRLVAPLIDIDRFSEIAAAQGAAAVALELAKQEAVTQAQEALQGDLVDAVRAAEREEVVQARARALGYPLDTLQIAIIARADENEGGEQLATWARRAHGLAESLGWRALATTSASDATILVAAPSVAGLRNWLADLRNMWLPDRAPLAIGVGEAGQGIEGLRRSLDQATDALALGLRLFGPDGDYLHSELGLYRLLRHLHGQADLEIFYQQTLAPLVAYDDAHGGELVGTLEALLAAGGNVSRAAQALHLHRNSLVYRLERIQQITGLNPTDAADAFTLKLALLLTPLRGSQP